VTKIKKNVCKRNNKRYLVLAYSSTPQLMPKNGLQGISEYAIQFSLAETVVVLGQVYREAFQVIRYATEKS